jgi:transcriptional regulator with XRE-family HTH domain
MQNKAVGARISERLELFERDQRWLARRVGKSPSLISRWMDGSRQMTPQELREVAIALHMEPTALFDALFDSADKAEQEKVA